MWGNAMDIISRKEAKRQGLKRYFTGKPCNSGHTCERYSSNGQCVDCCNDYRKTNRTKTKEYCKANFDKRKANNIEFLKAHPDYYKNYCKLHHTKITENRREYRKNNSKKIKERDRIWSKKHKIERIEYSRKYRQENPVKILALCAKRRADKRNRTAPWADLDAIRDIYQVARALTKISNITFSVDHIIPMMGELVSGLHVENNLQVIPLSENLKKNNTFNPIVFAQEMGMLL